MSSNTEAFWVLHESAVGYGLFDVVAFDEIVQDPNTVVERSRFMKAIKLKAFQPFENAIDALENANALSVHSMTPTLKAFLDMNLSSSDGTAKVKLGIIDAGLATAITEGLSSKKKISCRSDETVREILRGVRYHFDKYIKGLDGNEEAAAASNASTQAQLGLGHSYSRSKVKFNPARSDNMIIQTIALLDQMEKDLNTFSMRIREWYSWHFPELKDLVKDNYMYARVAAYIQDKNTLTTTGSKRKSDEDDEDEDDAAMDVDTNTNGGNGEDKRAGLLKIVGDDETLVDSIIAAAKTSMGMDCSVVDMVNIVNFTRRIIQLGLYRQQLVKYLSDNMNIVAPNLSTLLGDTVAARLISKAGSLTNLAKAPASTVQILGAEKALFRALKTKGNTPKYGIIYNSTFIGRAATKHKGRISRYLANKCSIATRIDSFSDEPPSRLYGEKLRDQVEERLKFYETGAQPRKNIDVMEEVAKRLAGGSNNKRKADNDSDAEEETKEETKKKKKKKDKKRKRDSVESTTTTDGGDNEAEAEEKEATKKAKTTDDEEKDDKKDKKKKKKKKKSMS